MIAYVGGKFRQAPWIYSLIKNELNKGYVEVFGGAFWTYIKTNIFLNVESVVYNDYNPFMANLFACFKEYEKFIPFLEKFPSQNEELFYECRNFVINHTTIGYKFDGKPNFELGVRYLYIATQSFSGVINEKVKFIDLKGKYSSKYDATCKRVKDQKIQKKLDKIEIFNLSYDELLPRMPEDYFLYLDPPYYNTESYYGFHDFGKDDHERLAQILRETPKKWALSYYEFDEMHEWYPESDFRWERKDYKKAASAKSGKKQNTGTELLVMNF